MSQLEQMRARSIVVVSVMVHEALFASGSEHTEHVAQAQWKFLPLDCTVWKPLTSGRRQTSQIIGAPFPWPNKMDDGRDDGEAKEDIALSNPPQAEGADS